MKRILLVLLVVMLLPVPAMAAMYVSPFGFVVDLPESEWRVINSKTIMKDAEVRRLFEKMLEMMESRWPIVEKKELMRMLGAGEVEYWDCKTKNANVTVTMEAGKGVIGRQYGKEEIEAAMKKMLGPDARIYRVGWEKLGGLESFWFEWGGMVHGERDLCLHVQVQEQVYLGFSLGAQEEDWASLRLKFWNVMRSFQWLR
jgi:hypothetical protein